MKGNKRELIREAAIQVFSEKGYHETRADEIAQAAGVAVGTIYNYFKNKEDILVHIFATEVKERKEFYEELQKSDLSVVEQIRRVLESHFQRVREHRELMQVLLREKLEPGERIKEELSRLYREVVSYIEEIIKRGVEEERISPCNPRIIAHAILGIVESVIGCGMIYSEREAAGIFREAPRELAEFIWNGLKNKEKE